VDPGRERRFEGCELTQFPLVVEIRGGVRPFAFPYGTRCKSGFLCKGPRWSPQIFG
jgi:hypothetical protein